MTAGSDSEPSNGTLFRAQYVPDYKEMFAVSRSSTSRHYSRSQRLIAWIAVLGYLLFILAMILADKWIARTLLALVGRPLAGILPMVLVIAFGIFWVWLICYRVLPRLSAHWLTQRREPEAITFSADADALRFTSESSGSWHKWTIVERIFVTPLAVCFLAGGVTLYVPRRAFADSSALERFVAACVPRLTEAAQAATRADPSMRQILRAAD